MKIKLIVYGEQSDVNRPQEISLAVGIIIACQFGINKVHLRYTVAPPGSLELAQHCPLLLWRKDKPDRLCQKVFKQLILKVEKLRQSQIQS